MNADGTAIEHRTELNPMTIPSPDGTGVVVFELTASGEWDLLVADPSYTNMQKIASTSDPFAPAWSPDGTTLAFRIPMDGNFEIFVATADGSDSRRLTMSPDVDDLVSSYWGGIPYGGSWSSDGTRIAFSRDFGSSQYSELPDNFAKVILIDADGTNERRLIDDNTSQDANPSWSPDDTKIAFFGFRDNQVVVSVINADGTGLREIAVSDDEFQDFAPVWSPDGTQIAFYTELEDAYAITVADADGFSLHQLTDHGTVSSNAFPLVWSPDGTQIAFASVQAGDAEIFVVDADGTGAHQLTDNNIHDWPISWS